MHKIGGWYRWLRGEGPLVRIGVAIGGMLALALAIAAAVALLGLRLLHFREFQPEPDLSAGTLYNLLKVAFAVAAGIGGVVALVTAYRRQRVAELTQELEATRLLNERFTTTAGQLGDGKFAVRLAGVYAMAGLADDWPQKRQTCVDVLCAYLRMPHEPEPAPDDPPVSQQTVRASREVRNTIIRVIAAHLRRPGDSELAAAQDWRGLDLDFTGAVFDDDVRFDGAEFSGGTVKFTGAKFSGGLVSFLRAEFSGGLVSFDGAEFSGGIVRFGSAQLSGGSVRFDQAQFSGAKVSFEGARFKRGIVLFNRAKFSAGVSFNIAEFSGAKVSFNGTEFSAAGVGFELARFSGSLVNFARAQFSGDVSFNEAQFADGLVSFNDAEFSTANVSFNGAEFSGGTVGFNNGARISGGRVSASATRESPSPDGP